MTDLSKVIRERVDRLTELWLSFTDDEEARLLRLLVDVDNRKMIEAFFTYQQEEQGDLPDLFVDFEAPFEDPSRHGRTLLRLLRDGYEESREEMDEVGIDTSWQCPEPRPDESDVSAFVRGSGSLARHYADLLDYLAVVLTPSRVPDYEGWVDWLLRLVRSSVPETVRFVVLDDAEAPLLDSLQQRAPGLVRTEHPDLDVSGAMEEVAREANDGSPEGRFRELLTTLNTAASERDASRVEELAQEALDLAREHEWWDMACTVFMLWGGVQLGEQKPRRSLDLYRKAAENAEKLEPEHPSRAMLRLQSTLAQGGALFQMTAYPEAAEVYESAVPLADAAENDFLKIDALRMAGACYQESDLREDAWRCHEAALGVGEALDEEQRVNSTLVYSGARLLKLTNDRPFDGQRHEVEQRLEALLGEKWREHLPEDVRG